MTETMNFDAALARINAGTRLSAAEIGELAATPDILALGMLADAQRRRLHADRVTYLRVATVPFEASLTDAVLPAAREVRLTGTPGSLAVAVTAVQQAKSVAGERSLTGFSWATVESLAVNGTPASKVLADLKAAGLDGLAEVALDGDPTAALDALQTAGYGKVRLTIDKAPAADRVALILRAAELQDRFGTIEALNPLPLVLNSFRPTTGYDDVKMVAIARLAAPHIARIQVDWLRYGPKLAQVALTFGADDFDGVTASDEAPEGWRRAPLEDVRRNITAAGFTPVERDGRFAVVNRES